MHFQSHSAPQRDHLAFDRHSSSGQLADRHIDTSDQATDATGSPLSALVGDGHEHSARARITQPAQASIRAIREVQE